MSTQPSVLDCHSTFRYDIASGTYHLRTTITNADNVSCQVRESASQEPYTLTIEEKSQTGIFSKATVYAQDEEEGSVQMEEL